MQSCKQTTVVIIQSQNSISENNFINYFQLSGKISPELSTQAETEEIVVQSQAWNDLQKEVFIFYLIFLF